MNYAIACPLGLLHVECLCEEAWIGRIYPNPVAPLMPDTGFPSKGRFSWVCTAHVCGDRLTVKGVLGSPGKDWQDQLFAAMWAMGIRRIEWEHAADSGRVRLFSFALSPSSLVVVPYPKADGRTIRQTETTESSATNQQTKPSNMTINSTTTIINEATGKSEIEVSVNVFNLDAKEAHDTALDLIGGTMKALSGFNPETGNPL